MKQEKQIKLEQFFQAFTRLFWRSMNRIRILFNGGLFLKIGGFKILLDQGDQFQIGLNKILQASNDQDHLIVQIGVALQNSINKDCNSAL